MSDTPPASGLDAPESALRVAEHSPGGHAQPDTGHGADAGLAHRKLIFCTCAVALLMVSINGSIVATALPRIGAALHSKINWTGWTITIYQLGQIIAAPISGRISDQFGRKTVFLCCIAIFTTSSLLCGLSVSIDMLLPLRFIQALGGGAFIASASGIISDHFGKDRDRAIGMFTSITPIGFILGPVFGGAIAQYWSWRGIFFVNVPIGIALFVLTKRFVPRSRTKETSGFDVLGVVYLISTLVTGMLAITTLGEKHASVPLIIASASVSVIVGWRFVRHSRSTEKPFIPVQLLFGHGFATMNLLNLLYGTAALGFATVVPLYAENRYHISITSAGTVLSARGVGTIIVAAAAAMMIRKTGYRLPMAAGFLSIAISLVMLSIAPRGMPAYWWLAIFAMVTGLGIGVAAPATNNATLQRAPDQVAGMVGLRQMFRQIGGILYISIATADLARSAHPGLEQAHLFLIQAVILTVMIRPAIGLAGHLARPSWLVSSGTLGSRR
jgi:EmrB/QacA subfamily drug resistance transporter